MRANVGVAFESAKCHIELSEKAKGEGSRAPNLFDFIALSTAKVLNAKKVTGNEDFRNLRNALDKLVCAARLFLWMKALNRSLSTKIQRRK